MSSAEMNEKREAQGKGGLADALKEARDKGLAVKKEPPLPKGTLARITISFKDREHKPEIKIEGGPIGGRQIALARASLGRAYQRWKARCVKEGQFRGNSR